MCHQSKTNYVFVQGLITKERTNIDPAAAPFAKDPRELEGLSEGANLLEVVSFLKLPSWLGLLS